MSLFLFAKLILPYRAGLTLTDVPVSPYRIDFPVHTSVGREVILHWNQHLFYTKMQMFLHMPITNFHKLV